jgi:hypothetical protein
LAKIKDRASVEPSREDMPMIRAPIFAFALLAAACTPPTEEQPNTAATENEQMQAATPQTAEEATAQDLCGASRFQNLIGTLASEIDQATLPAGTRVLTPDAIVTQDFRPDRLNIMSGTDGRVSSLSCY